MVNFIWEALNSMTEKIKVYQKPTCSKCRTTIGILKDRGVEFESINYYENPLTSDELRKLIDRLGIEPRELLRKGEKVYRDLELSRRDVSDDQLLELMVENPDLIQRPIVVKGQRAVLGRLPENVEDLL
jgi:arsenate reductase (glutaredoxin)